MVTAQLVTGLGLLTTVMGLFGSLELLRRVMHRGMRIHFLAMRFFCWRFNIADGCGPCADVTRQQEQQNDAAGQGDLIFAHVAEHVVKYSPWSVRKERPRNLPESSTRSCDGVLGFGQHKTTKLGRYR